MENEDIWFPVSSGEEINYFLQEVSIPKVIFNEHNSRYLGIWPHSYKLEKGLHSLGS